MGEVFIWHLFNELVIRRFVWGEPTDASAVQKALESGKLRGTEVIPARATLRIDSLDVEFTTESQITL